jgi:hypothetical protein
MKVRHGVVSWMVMSMLLAHSRGPRISCFPFYSPDCYLMIRYVPSSEYLI